MAWMKPIGGGAVPPAPSPAPTPTPTPIPDPAPQPQPNWGGAMGGNFGGGLNIPALQFLLQMQQQPGGMPQGGLMSAFPFSPGATAPMGVPLSLPQMWQPSAAPSGGLGGGGGGGFLKPINSVNPYEGK